MSTGAAEASKTTQTPLPQTHAAWGRLPGAVQQLLPLFPASLSRIASLPQPLLGYGLGRSYGDSCQNSGGLLLATRALNHIQHFDRESGLLRAESGVTLAEILALCATPNADGSHWFPPVLPGTCHVTLGGAVANDVHGKNHLAQGSFGCHVVRLWLRRSDGSEQCCSREESSELFHATIGGLGLTGLITAVEIQLLRVAGMGLEVESKRFADVREFAALSAGSEAWDYQVAWVDCTATRSRGVFSRARHVEGTPEKAKKRPLTIPFALPFCPLRGPVLRAFNALYYRLSARDAWQKKPASPTAFFHPLDSIGGWNKLYGPCGFYQYQCVIPGSPEHAMAGIEALLAAIQVSGQGSFLAVLKRFGNISSGGLLSFPRAGLTLALDFPNRGEETLELLTALDAITLQHGGRLYPAKDARVPAVTFHAMYPETEQFARHRDMGFLSDFWRRVRPSKDDTNE